MSAGWVLLAWGIHLRMRDALLAVIICCVWSCTNTEGIRFTVLWCLETMCMLQVVSSACGCIGFFGSAQHCCCFSTQYHMCFSDNGHHCKMSEICYTSLVFFIWRLVPFEGHFLAMPQKCHSACWSGLDSGQKAKKRKKRWEEENLLRGRKNVLFFYKSRHDILDLAYLSKGCVLVPCYLLCSWLLIIWQINSNQLLV